MFRGRIVIWEGVREGWKGLEKGNIHSVSVSHSENRGYLSPSFSLERNSDLNASNPASNCSLFSVPRLPYCSSIWSSREINFGDWWFFEFML